MTLLRAAAVLLALAATAATAAAQFVVPEGSDFHNGSSLPLLDEGDDEAQLRRLQTALRDGSVGVVLDVLRLLREDGDVRLVPFGPRTHVPALERATQLVAAADSPSLREAVEDDARRAIAAARARRDVDALVDRATRGRALESSTLAATHAARLLYEAGHWWGAASMVALVDAPDEALVELGERARERAARGDALPTIETPTSDVFSWRWAVGVRHALDTEPGVGLPLVIDGRDDELLLVDSVGLHGFDPVAQERTLGSFRWKDEVLRRMRERRFISTLPAPRQHSVARSGDRLVVPFNVPTDINRSRSARVKRSAMLVAVDLLDSSVVGPGDPGAVVVWTARPRGEGAEAAFGPPLVRGQRVFALVYRVDLQTEVSLACFDLTTGAPLWETPLVLGVEVRRFASRRAETSAASIDKRARTAELAERDGVIHASTGYGVVAAVDGWTGVVRHTFRYDRVFSLEPSVYDSAYLFDPEPSGWNDEPVRLWDERVVVAPSDSRYLYVLADEPGPRGHLILDDPIERLDRVDVVTLVPDPDGRPSPAILATQRRDGRLAVVMLDSNGHVLRRTPALSTNDSRLLPDTSRPIALGTDVLVPTATGVHVFDTQTEGAAPRVLTGPLLGSPLPTAALWRTSSGLIGLTPQVGRDAAVLVQVWREP